MKTSFVAAMVAALTIAYEDGVWTGQDWYDEDEGLGVKNGVPYGQDPETQRRINSATLQSGPDVQNEDKENVRMIMEVFGEEDFEHLFPLHDKLYTYEAFTVAAGLFPKFCGETDESLGLTEAEVCKRELATLFSHVIFETNGSEPDHHEYFR